MVVSDGRNQIVLTSIPTNYIVNLTTSGHVMFLPPANESSVVAANVFTIVPQSAVFIDIHQFNPATDVINIAAFTTIGAWEDLNITLGSVIVNLPDQQTIKLRNLTPTDISDRNFIFGSTTQNAKEHQRMDRLSQSTFILIGVSVVLASALLGAVFHRYQRHTKLTSKVADLHSVGLVTFTGQSAVGMTDLAQNRTHELRFDDNDQNSLDSEQLDDFTVGSHHHSGSDNSDQLSEQDNAQFQVLRSNSDSESFTSQFSVDIDDDQDEQAIYLHSS